LLAAYLTADYSALSRKWQFLLLKLTYCCKGSRTGFVLVSRGQTLFGIGTYVDQALCS